MRLLFAGDRRRSCMFFYYEHGDLNLKEISTRGPYTLDLEQVFGELRVDASLAHQTSSEWHDMPTGCAPMCLLVNPLRGGEPQANPRILASLRLRRGC
jgi:hypothetical protein